MANVRIDWRGPEVQRSVEREMSARMGQVGEMLASQIRLNLSQPQPPSLPGDFPHVLKGPLRQSIHWERTDDLGIRVGSPLVYAAVHEYGERSFVRRTFAEIQNKLIRVLTRAIPGLSGGRLEL